MKKSFSRIYIFTFLFLFLTNTSFALTPLPKNAYLKYNDNQKEVLILQQILNSNKDTQIASSGVGSPGKETWFFGVLTENALKKFQEKYGLEITGEINYKTWIKLNDYVTSINNPIKKTVTTKIETKKATTSVPEEDQTPNKDIKKEVVEKKSEPTYLESLISKYTNALSSLKPQTSSSSPDQSITYSAASPYYNPQTVLCQSSPVSTSPTSGGYSNMNAPGYYSQGLPFGSTGGFTYQPGGPITHGDIRNAGQITGDAGVFGQCKASSFAHATFNEGCVADPNDQQNGQRSASGIILSRAGVPAIPAVALPRSGKLGRAVEVKNMVTGICKAFPLLDRGPAPYIVARGTCIDLTGSALDILNDRPPCKFVGPLNGKEGSASISKIQYVVVADEIIKPGEVKDCKHLGN